MVSPNKQILAYKTYRKEYSRAYLAGLIDGDGSIYICHSKKNNGRKSDQYILRVKLVTLDYDTVLFIISRFGGCVHQSKKDGLYHIFWHCSKAQHLLHKIGKYLILKKNQSRLALSITESSSSSNINKYNQMHNLNTENKKRVIKNIKMKNSLFYAYMSGLIDSDGSITIKNPENDKCYPFLFLKITGVNKSFLEVIKTRAGGNIRKSRDWFDIYWYGISAKRLLERIQKFLIYKKERAVVGLRFQITKNKKRKSSIIIDYQNQLIKRIRELNSGNRAVATTKYE